MAFNPAAPFTLTSMSRGGISGRVSVVTVTQDGSKCVASSRNGPSNVSVSPFHRDELVSILSALDLESLPHEDGSRGYDLSIWSVYLTQGKKEWRFSMRTDQIAHSPAAPLRAVLDAIAENGARRNKPAT